MTSSWIFPKPILNALIPRYIFWFPYQKFCSVILNTWLLFQDIFSYYMICHSLTLTIECNPSFTVYAVWRTQRDSKQPVQVTIGAPPDLNYILTHLIHFLMSWADYHSNNADFMIRFSTFSNLKSHYTTWKCMGRYLKCSGHRIRPLTHPLVPKSRCATPGCAMLRRQTLIGEAVFWDSNSTVGLKPSPGFQYRCIFQTRSAKLTEI